MFDEIQELSDPPYTAMQLACSQAQKRSKEIGSINVMKLREYFLCTKKTKIITINNSSSNNVFCCCGEHHDTCILLSSAY